MTTTESISTQNTTDRPYWTPSEMIESGQWPFGRANLYKALREGSIPSIRFGKKFVIPKSAFMKRLAEAGGAA